MTPERIERALVEVTREAKSDTLPHVDWERIEAELPMARVHTLPPRAMNYRPLLVAAAFAVGLGALGLRWAGSPVDSPVAALPKAAPAAAAPAVAGVKDIDGDKLVVGAHVTAGDLAQPVVHAGHARWTLARHSEGTLLTTGDIVTVRLDRGSVTSRVTKSSRTETFAIEAANVRVAAHGTEFVVALGADGVSVSVTEGTVLVGPREEPGTGQLLISPTSRRFTLAGLPLEDDKGLDAFDSLRAGGAARRSGASADTTPGKATQGTPGAVALSAPAPQKKSALRAPVATEPEAPSAPEEDPVAEQPTAEALEAATGAVLALTQACFKARTIAGEGVRVTAQTSVTFRTLPKGGVNKVVFEPPLSPVVQACVNAGMSAIHTDATRFGFQVSRTVDLER